MKKLYIVVLNWKHADDTIECLDSLQSIKLPSKINTTLLVVDNNSGESDLKKLHEYKSKLYLEIIENSENYGFAGGNNIGLKHAMNNQADYMIVINNDTRVDQDFAAELIKTANLADDIAVVSPKIYFEKGYEFHKDRYKKSELGKVIWYAGGKYDWDNFLGSNNGVDEIDNGQFESRTELKDFATGACFLITRKAILKSGFFDERYFMYLEDVELSQRIYDSGLKIIFEPKSVIWHKVSQSSGIGSDLNDYFLTRNRLLLAQNKASLRTKFALHREAWKYLLFGRKWQKKGVVDFYKNKLSKGSWVN